MSEFHSERHSRNTQLTVRVRLVNLNATGASSALSSPSLSAERYASKTQLSSIANIIADRPGPGNLTETKALDNPRGGGEICVATTARIPYHEFEAHVEECALCSNRVALQLDFMETLELALYQRQAEPRSKKIRGAMLVSAPKLNFAICGELER